MSPNDQQAHQHTFPVISDQAAGLRAISRQQAQIDLARVGAEVTRLARAAAAMHANEAAETARAQAQRAQVLRDQASRLRSLMQARTHARPEARQ
jgi:hypothetical protein